jgi:hypothetical protein
MACHGAFMVSAYLSKSITVQPHHSSMDLQPLWDWLFNLGKDYGVDPLVFGIIYIGTVPPFWASLAWMVRNARLKKPITLPAAVTGFFFIASYLYVAVAGRNLPWWIYGIIVFLAVAGGVTTVWEIRKRIQS